VVVQPDECSDSSSEGLALIETRIFGSSAQSGLALFHGLWSLNCQDANRNVSDDVEACPRRRFRLARMSILDTLDVACMCVGTHALGVFHPVVAIVVAVAVAVVVAAAATAQSLTPQPTPTGSLSASASATELGTGNEQHPY
jgi:hypothetical protein